MWPVSVRARRSSRNAIPGDTHVVGRVVARCKQMMLDSVAAQQSPQSEGLTVLQFHSWWRDLDGSHGAVPSRRPTLRSFPTAGVRRYGLVVRATPWFPGWGEEAQFREFRFSAAGPAAALYVRVRLLRLLWGNFDLMMEALICTSKARIRSRTVSKSTSFQADRNTGD